MRDSYFRLRGTTDVKEMESNQDKETTILNRNNKKVTPNNNYVDDVI